VTHFDKPDILLNVSRNLGEPMVGINVTPETLILGKRGW
jgi:pyridoxal 5'-phosphate synthase pdxS subunit